MLGLHAVGGLIVGVITLFFFEGQWPGKPSQIIEIAHGNSTFLGRIPLLKHTHHTHAAG